MKYSRVQLQNTISTVLLAVSFCVQMPLAAQADDATVFVPETPSLDSSPPAQESPAPSQSSTVLNGSVRKRNTLPGPDGDTASKDVTQSGGASANDAQLQPETAAADADRRYQLAAKKLASRAKMTSDDFRDLQIGIAGAETTRTFTKKTAKVDQVFPGCPAALAGI